MGMLRECSVEGCGILTIGPLCIEHDRVAEPREPETPAHDADVVPPPSVLVYW